MRRRGRAGLPASFSPLIIDPASLAVGRVVPGQGVIFMSFESIQAWVEAAIEEDK